MPNYASLQSSPLTKTHAASPADADGIKAATTNSTALALYTGVALDGISAGAIRATTFAGMTVSMTASSTANAFNITDPVVFTGTYKGKPQTESLRFTSDDGNQKIEGVKPFDVVTSILRPPQLLASGTIQYGYEDIACDGEREAIRRIVVGVTAGDLALLYQGIPEIAAPTDTMAAVAASTHDVAPRAIDGSLTTCWPITVYY